MKTCIFYQQLKLNLCLVISDKLVGLVFDNKINLGSQDDKDKKSWFFLNIFLMRFVENYFKKFSIFQAETDQYYLTNIDM